MKNKIIKSAIVIVAILLIPSAYLLGRFQRQEVHTYKNVAIYYNNYIIDEDGEKIKCKLDCPSNTSVYVTYNNNDTVTRRDDIIIDYEIVNKELKIL